MRFYVHENARTPQGGAFDPLQNPAYVLGLQEKTCIRLHGIGYQA